MSSNSGVDWFVGLAGFVAAFALAGVLEGPGTSWGTTNVALLLAAVVVAAGVVGRRRGALTTAVGAALSFNFFHARPIHSLQIAAGKDVATVVLLAVIGLVVGELAQRHLAATTGSRVGRVELDLLHESAELANSRPARGEMVFHTTAAIAQLLGADAVMFQERSADAPVPAATITHRGTIEGIPFRSIPAGYDLGHEPIAIAVANGPDVLGHMIVTPHPGHPVPLDARVGAVILADHLALSLSASAPAASDLSRP